MSFPFLFWTRSISLYIWSHKWLNLRKVNFHMHNSKTHFHHQMITVHINCRYWSWKLPRLLLLWLVSEACQMSTGDWVVFPSPLNKQTACCNSSHDWLMSLAMALCDILCAWQWKWHQWMPFDCFQCWCSLCLPLCGSTPIRVLWHWLHQ